MEGTDVCTTGALDTTLARHGWHLHHCYAQLKCRTPTCRDCPRKWKKIQKICSTLFTASVTYFFSQKSRINAANVSRTRSMPRMASDTDDDDVDCSSDSERRITRSLTTDAHREIYSCMVSNANEWTDAKWTSCNAVKNMEYEKNTWQKMQFTLNTTMQNELYTVDQRHG